MRILIVKTSSLGDILHTFPALHDLATLYPQAKIDWVVEEDFKDLVKAHPLVNNVICVKVRQWRKAMHRPSTWQEINQYRKQAKGYDLILDFQGNLKSGLLLSLARGVKIGYCKRSAPEWINALFTHEHHSIDRSLPIREEYRQLVQKAFGAPPSPMQLHVDLEVDNAPILEESNAILVCPGAHWPNKQLLPETLLTFLKRFDQPVLFAWGNRSEEIVCQQIAQELSCARVLPRYSLPQLQCVMRQVSLVLAMDSLPLHLAATTHTPTFAFFGPSSAHKYGIGEGYVQGECPYGEQFVRRCRKLRTCPTGACMRAMPLEQIVERFERFRENLLVRH